MMSSRDSIQRWVLDSKNLLLYVQGNKETTGLYLENALVEMCELITKYAGGTYQVGESN